MKLTRLQNVPETVNQEPEGMKDVFVMWNPILANSFMRILARSKPPF